MGGWVGIAVSAAAVVAAAVVSYRDPSYRWLPDNDVPGLISLLHGGDHVHGANVEGEIEKYTTYHTATKATDRDQKMVNYYYNLVTDFYEYGWGKSFHFAHTKVDESHEASIVRHEMRVAKEIRAERGMHILDVGCGVGGPARTIANASGASITGVTLNRYQVERAGAHTAAAGLEHMVNIVEGDFTKMPQLASGSFDAAYAIESTCHAPKLQDAYAEVFRVLKPGARFAAFEWITAKGYQSGDEDHNRILREIEFGNGLPPIKSRTDVLEAASAVGFVLESDVDLAQDRDNTKAWWSRLAFSKPSYYLTHCSVYILELLGLAPKGTVSVHGMLLRGAWGLVEGGEANVFTPMHLFVFSRPKNRT